MSVPEELERRLSALSPKQRELLLHKLRRSAAASVKTIPVGPRDQPAPLAPTQVQLWLRHRLDPGSAAYHMPLAVRARGPLDLDALQGALRTIVDRHDVLRSVFTEDDEGPRQQVRPSLSIELERSEAAGPDAGARLGHAVELAARAVRRPFDLMSGPLVRAHAIGLAPDDHVVLLVAHHIVADGWSLLLLLREVVTAYLAASRGEALPLPPPPIQYADYARWLRERVEGPAGERALAYWTQQLQGAPTRLTLPTDRPAPAHRDPSSRALPLVIPVEQWRGIEALAQRAEATPFMVLVAAWALVLGRAAGQDEVMIGTPLAGRDRPEVRDLIGLLVDTTVLRVCVDGEPTFDALVQQVRGTVLDAFTHQPAPFDRVVDAVHPEHDPSITPLFQAMLILQPDGAGASPPLADVTLEPFVVDSGAADHDLVLTLAPSAEGARGLLHYSTTLWDEGTIEALGRALLYVLTQVTTSGASPLRAIELVDPAERLVLVHERNATELDLGPPASVHELFARQVEHAPDATALRFEDRAWSYAALEAASATWAQRLRERGIGPERVVAVCMQRSPEMVLAVLSVLRAGGAYLPLSPEWPAERMTIAARDAGASLLLHDASVSAAAVATGLPALQLDDTESWTPADPTLPTASAVTDASLAYVICTSGSTGRPKVVQCTHGGLTNRLRWQHTRLPIGAHDRVLHKTPFTFDVSVWELLWPLIHGATMVIARPGGHREADYLVDLIATEQIHVLHFVPSMLDPFLSAVGSRPLPSLRAMICSGEALPPAAVSRVAAAVPGVELYNLYGPTEAAIDVTAWRCEPDERRASVPIGRPIANMRTYVLDDELRPVPRGFVGDLYLAGVGLARGYAAAPGLTAERFVPDPFAPTLGERMYRTGDRARWRSEGPLEFLGRSDHQVKLRGHRIELGEIEAVLAQHPSVHAAAVLLREDIPGDLRLVAYAAAPVDAPAPEQLRAHLAEHLPAAMVPAAVVVLDRLPTTDSGKIDRRALPAATATSRPSSQPPRTRLEQTIAEIWSELLNTPTTGVHDDFFSVGGHSLLVMQLATRLHARLGAEIPLRVLFDRPTVEGISVAVSAALALARPQAERDQLLTEIEAMSATEAATALAERRG